MPYYMDAEGLKSENQLFKVEYQAAMDTAAEKKWNLASPIKRLGEFV